MEKFDYEKLTSRNGYFISEKLQKEIRGKTLVFIGCGLASTVAVSAARIGFSNFILIDGDNVELNNLNRQNFYYKDLGRNKALVTSEKILEINPTAKTEVTQNFVGVDEVKEYIKKGDIVINSADFDEVTYAVDEVTAKLGKISISPLNIGFGSVIAVFSNKSKRLSEMTNGIAKNDKQYLLKYYKSLQGYKLPNYVQKSLAKIFFFIARKGYFPQNIIAAHLSSAIILNIIVNYLEGAEVRLAPRVYNLDARVLDENLIS